MKPRFYTFLLLALSPLAIVAAGCGEDDPVEPEIAKARAQILFAADALTASDIVIDRVELGLTKIFGDLVPYDSVRASNVDVVIRSAGTGTKLYDKTMNFVEDQNYTLFVVNDSTGNVSIVRFRDDLTAPPSGKALVRFAHLIYDGPEVRVGLAGTGVKLTEGVSYAEVTEFFNTNDTGTFSLRVIDTGETGGGGQQGGAEAIVEGSVRFEAGGIYTVAAYGSSAQAELKVIRHN